MNSEQLINSEMIGISEKKIQCKDHKEDKCHIYLSGNIMTQITNLKVLVLFFPYVPDAADGATNGGGQVCKNLSNSQWTVHTNSSLSLGNDLKAKNNKLKGGHFQITLAFYYAMYLLSLLNGILEPFSEHLFSRKLVEFYSHILAKLEVIQILRIL